MSREKFSPFANISELPPELLEQLRIGDDTDSRILKIFEEGGGTLNVSEVLVGLYSMFKEVKKRTYISAVLYKMKNKGLLMPTGKKGEYTTDTKVKILQETTSE